MLEQIAAFLIALVVAAAGAVGIDTASTAPHGVGSPEIASARATEARQEAAERLAAVLEAAALGAEQSVEVAVADDGLETAAEAITAAPAAEDADFGLSTAFEQVTSAPGGAAEANASAGPPEGVPPADPPTDTPGGRP